MENTAQDNQNSQSEASPTPRDMQLNTQQVQKQMCWATLRGIPRNMKWLVQIVKIDETTASVYCKADDAVFSVKVAEVEMSTAAKDSFWEQRGLKCLSKKKSLLACFKDDIEWDKNARSMKITDNSKQDDSEPVIVLNSDSSTPTSMLESETDEQPVPYCVNSGNDKCLESEPGGSKPDDVLSISHGMEMETEPVEREHEDVTVLGSAEKETDEHNIHVCRLTASQEYEPAPSDCLESKTDDHISPIQELLVYDHLGDTTYIRVSSAGGVVDNSNIKHDETTTVVSTVEDIVVSTIMTNSQSLPLPDLQDSDFRVSNFKTTSLPQGVQADDSWIKISLEVSRNNKITVDTDETLINKIADEDVNDLLIEESSILTDSDNIPRTSDMTDNDNIHVPRTSDMIIDNENSYVCENMILSDVSDWDEPQKDISTVSNINLSEAVALLSNAQSRTDAVRDTDDTSECFHGIPGSVELQKKEMDEKLQNSGHSNCSSSEVLSIAIGSMVDDRDPVPVLDETLVETDMVLDSEDSDSNLSAIVPIIEWPTLSKYTDTKGTNAEEPSCTEKKGLEEERRMRESKYDHSIDENDLMKPDEKKPSSDKNWKRKIGLESEEVTTKKCKYFSDTVSDNDKEVNSESPRQDVIESDFTLRDTKIRGIYIKKYRLKKPRKYSGQSKATRIYDNTHACFICDKIVLHINLHLKTHRNCEEVKKVLVTDKPDFTALRKLGDDKHNRECIERGEGEIILARRPNDNVFDVSLYGPCPDCREWVLLKGLKYHNKECTKHLNIQTKKKKTDLVLQSQVLAGYVKLNSSPLMMKEVLPIMTSDEVTKVAQDDPLIMALGESWLRRNVGNREKRKYYASARMRLCARLLTQLRTLQNLKFEANNLQKPNVNESKLLSEEVGMSKEETSASMKQTASNDVINAAGKKFMWDFLKPQHFEDVVLAALKCSLPDADDNEDLVSPSNCIKLKYDLGRLVNSKWAFVVKNTGNEDDKEARECKSFMGLMEIEWKEKVTTMARTVLCRRKFEEVKELPSPKDIEHLSKYLVQQMRSVPLMPENFKQVVVTTQTRLLLYNKRRTGELEVIKLQSYASRSTGLNDLDRSLADDLTKFEKRLLESQDLMKVRGKGGRPVPVIIPPYARKSLAFLADKEEREKAGIVKGNSYLFPNSTNYYARAYESLKNVCGELNLVAPHRITSVSMRKYTATLTQMLNLDKYQMEWVYSHLGHTKSVHKEHYRQMSGLLERTEISKILLIQDLNLTSKFKGKKLEEMDIKDIVFPDEAVEDANDDLSEKLSVPEEIISREELTYFEEAQKQEEMEDMEDEEEEDDEYQPQKKRATAAKKMKRQRWVETEFQELRVYFKDFLTSGTTPKAAFIEKIKQISKQKNGLLHLRANHLIVKKISYMNHSKH